MSYNNIHRHKSLSGEFYLLMKTEQTENNEHEKQPKKKKSKWRKILKITLITLLSIVFLVLLAIGIALYVVFTPSKVTKVVNTYADRFLNADVNIQKVDITFLSTFPDFYLVLDSGSIVSHALDADAPNFGQKRDSLLCFDHCRIQLDPIKYLKNKAVDIEEITFEGVSAYAFVTPSGKANWNIALPSEPDTTESEFVIDDYVSSLNLKKLTFNTKKVIYEDSSTNLYASFNDLNLALSGDFRQMKAATSLEFDFGGINLKSDSVQIASNLNIGLKTKLLADLDSSRFQLDSAALYVNNNRFKLDGYVALPDTQTIDMDLWINGQIPALDLLKQLVPTAYLPILAHVDAKGRLDVDACISGKYAPQSFPVAKVSLFLADAYLNYDALGFDISDINLVADAFVDLNKVQSSHANVDRLSLRSSFLSADLSATANDLLGDPLVSAKGKLNANIDKTLHYFPVLPKGTFVSGDAGINLKVSTLLSSVTNLNLERIKADAQVALSRFSVKMPSDTLYASFPKANINLKTNSLSQRVGGKALIDAQASIDSLKLLYASLAKGTVGNVAVDAQMAPDRKNIVTSTVAKIDLTSPNLKLIEDMDFASTSTTVNFAMLPSDRQPASPVITLGLDTRTTNILYDSIDAHMNDGKIDIKLRPLAQRQIQKRDSLRVHRDSTQRRANRTPRYLDLNTSQTIDYLLASLEPDTTATDTVDMVQNFLKCWNVDTRIKLSTAKVITPDMNYSVRIPSADLALDGRDLTIHNLGVNMRRTDVQLSGIVKHVRRSLLGRAKWEADLALNSTLIKASDLMNLMKSSAQDSSSATASNTADTTKSEIIVVPNNFDITLNTNLKEVRYDKAVLNNVNGKVALRNSYIILDGLNFSSELGNVNTTLFYKAADKSGAEVSADLKVDKLNITKLVNQVPMIDTMLPMLRSFEGLISADIMALGKLTSDFGIDIPSLNASCLVRGDSLVLLDNETFRKLSKILLFKNKDRNLIDSLSLEFVMKNKVINFFPFVFAMDRYRVGILGTQYADMTFDYKFVVLKWPLLLKLLVGYKGDLNDLDNAKLKIRLDKKKNGYAKEFENKETFSIVRKQIQSVLRKGRQDAMKTD